MTEKKKEEFENNDRDVSQGTTFDLFRNGFMRPQTKQDTVILSDDSGNPIKVALSNLKNKGINP